MKYKKLFDFIDNVEIPNKKDLNALYECLNDRHEVLLYVKGVVWEI